MSLHLTPLRNAVTRRREGLERYRQDTADIQIRDGLIHRFKVTYDLSHKSLKRVLVASASNPGATAEMSFADLIRAGSEAGLLKDGWPAWRGYREMRSKTSHAYDESVALVVVATIPPFLCEAGHLLVCLKERLG